MPVNGHLLQSKKNHSTPSDQDLIRTIYDVINPCILMIQTKDANRGI